MPQMVGFNSLVISAAIYLEIIYNLHYNYFPKHQPFDLS